MSSSGNASMAGFFNIGGFATDGYVLSADGYSEPISIRSMVGGAVQCQNPATGSPVGTLKLQFSNYLNRLYPSGNLCDSDADPNTWQWVDDTGTGSVAVSGAAVMNRDFGARSTVLGYRWVRLNWHKTSGSITLTGVFNFKG